MPASKTWIGSTGDFNDGSNWSPSGVPGQGVTAFITSGTVFATSLNPQVIIQLYAPAQLDLINAIIPFGNIDVAGGGLASTPVLLLEGTVTNAAYMVFRGTNDVVQLAATDGIGSGTLVNTTTISIDNGSVHLMAATGAATPTLVNNGTISVDNSGSSSSVRSSTLAAELTGKGKLNIGAQVSVEFGGGVSDGQSLSFVGSTGSVPSNVQVDAPAAFRPTISSFMAGDTITLVNTPYTTASYAVTSATSGVLTLSNGSTVTSAVNFSGVYSLSNFTFSTTSTATATSAVQIGTFVHNSISGSQSASTAAGPVYRFFDTVHGTHFFTADPGEGDAVNSSRSDLVEETNGFGDVQATDLNSVAVFRFFDTRLGTHFFTSSLAERDATIANRSDLTFEPLATFYEHAIQQSGDTPVYRFFDAVNGTHFYTGDASEYAGLVTPGTASYRPNLVSEGVSFYAPTGTFVR